MKRTPSWVILVGVATAAVVVVAVIGGFGTTRTTLEVGPTGPIPDPAGDGSSGVIFELRGTGGFTVFGLTLRSLTYEAYIGFVPPPGCLTRDESGHEELLSVGACADLPARGPVSGGGRTTSGLDLVIVKVEISKACYEALSVGSAWPTDVQECRS